MLYCCVFACVCVCISGSDRHTFTPRTPIASLLPLPHFPTTVPCSHVAELHSALSEAWIYNCLPSLSFCFSAAAFYDSALPVSAQSHTVCFQTFSFNWRTTRGLIRYRGDSAGGGVSNLAGVEEVSRSSK